MSIKDWPGMAGAATVEEPNRSQVLERKEWAALVDGGSVEEAANAEAVDRIRQRSIDAAEAFRERARMGEINARALTAGNEQSVIAIANTLSDAELREQLAAAIDEYSRAATIVNSAVSNLARAQEQADTADSELRRYDDLDNRITQWRVDQIKHNRSDLMPDELTNALANRSQVTHTAKAAALVVDHLKAELQTANSTLEYASQKRTKAAVAVIVKSETSLAAEIADAVDTIVEARRKLTSIASVWVNLSGRTAPIPLTQTAHRALNQLLEEKDSTPVYRHSVREWFDALLTNADGEEPSWTL